MQAKASDKTKRHRVLRPILYHGKGEFAEKMVRPGEAELTFEHLTDAGYLLLRAKGVIAPADEKKSTPAGAQGGE